MHECPSEVLGEVREFLPVESFNAAIGVLALSLYVYLLGRKASETRQMKKTIRTKDEEISIFSSSPGWWARLCKAGGFPRIADGWQWSTMPEHEYALASQTSLRMK